MLRQVLMMRPETRDDDVDPGAQCDTAAVLTSALSALHWSLHSPECAVRTVFSSVSAHWYSQLLGNLMGFYLNWNCLIYKLIYFLYSKNKPNQTPDYKPRMRISAYINSLLSTTKENESLKKYPWQFTRYFNHQNTSRSNIKIQ